jgi:hypothetical protein
MRRQGHARLPSHLRDHNGCRTSSVQRAPRVSRTHHICSGGWQHGRETTAQGTRWPQQQRRGGRSISLRAGRGAALANRACSGARSHGSEPPAQHAGSIAARGGAADAAGGRRTVSGAAPALAAAAADAALRHTARATPLRPLLPRAATVSAEASSTASRRRARRAAAASSHAAPPLLPPAYLLRPSRCRTASSSTPGVSGTDKCGTTGRAYAAHICAAARPVGRLTRAGAHPFL